MEKKLGIGAIAVCVVTIVVALFMSGVASLPGMSNGLGSGAYRVVGVSDYNGTSTITHINGDVVEIYDGIMLKNGDDVLVEDKDRSDATLGVDSDKYLYAEKATHFWLEAEGKPGASKSMIHLATGSTMHRLDTKLNPAERYQVRTPNATMSVRGTVFLVYVYQGSDGLTYSLLMVLEGVVVVDIGNGITAEFKEGEAALVRDYIDDGSGQIGEFILTDEVLPEFYTNPLFDPSQCTDDGSGVPQLKIPYVKIHEESLWKLREWHTRDGRHTILTLQDLDKLIEEAHVYDDGVITTAPTCLKPGIKTYTCRVCDLFYTEPVPATGHSYGASVVEPTCTEAGYTLHTCANCGDNYKTNPTAAAGHKPTTPEAVEATCKETGLEGGSVCSVCGKVFEKQTVVDALGHDWGAEEEGTTATCTEPGTIIRTCSRCDATMTTDKAALGHDWAVDADETTATCTKAGKIVHKCTRCSSSKTEEGEAALGHDLVEVPAVEATCTEAGKTAGKKCSRCDYEEPGETVKKLGHAYSSTTSGTTTTYTCSRCGDTYSETEESAPSAPTHTHNYGTWTVTKAATCTETGTETGTCSCGATSTQTIAASGHTSGDTVNVTKAPTCTDTGLQSYICTVCGVAVDDEEIPALGHDWELVRSGTGYVYECGRGECNEVREHLDVREVAPACTDAVTPYYESRENPGEYYSINDTVASPVATPLQINTVHEWTTGSWTGLHNSDTVVEEMNDQLIAIVEQIGKDNPGYTYAELIAAVNRAVADWSMNVEHACDCDETTLAHVLKATGRKDEGCIDVKCTHEDCEWTRELGWG